MSQDIVQKVADKHPFQGKTYINDKHRELKANVSSVSFLINLSWWSEKHEIYDSKYITMFLLI